MTSALETMRVLDMTQYEAGTSGTQLLAWLGAEVVKLEPVGGDPGRALTPDQATISQYFLNYNSNKKSVAINLKSEVGRRLFLDLVPKFDVFVENYGAGVMEELGIAYETLREVHPGIIYGRIKGFGLTGPYSQYNCFDWVAQAAAGAFSITGEKDGPPMMPGPTVGDSGTGTQMALAITAAYVQKLQTGVGQLIEISMQEAVTLFMRTQGLASWGTAPAVRSGNRRGSGAPTIDVYPCEGGGPNDYVLIFVATSGQWDALCTAMDRVDLLVDPRFCDEQGRIDNADALYSEIEAWTRGHPKYEAMYIVAGAGVPCSAILDTHEVFSDPQLLARGFFKTVVDANGAERTVMGSPLRMSASDVTMRAAPTLGGHTVEILTSDLALTLARIKELRELGVIAAAD